MTGARPPRGTGRDPWRGARPPRPQAEDGSGGRAGRHAELEEIEDVQIARPRGARPGAGATVAALLLVGLLAAGLGVLGGGPDASPTGSPAGPSPGAAATVGDSGPPTPITAQPVVTPFAACAPDTGAPLAVLLETNTTPVAGLIQAVDGDGGGEPTLPPADSGPHGPHVDVRPDAVTEIWIEGGRCALDWAIELYDPRTEGIELLDAISNATLDPAYAAQNRFQLATLAAYRGGDADLELRAGLTLEDRRGRVRASWAVRILPLDWPKTRLVAGERSIPVVAGCDLTMNLGNGYQEVAPGSDCGDDVSVDLPEASAVKAGEALELRLDGWTVTDAAVACGHLSGRSFVSEPVPGCWLPDLTSGAFDAPEDAGWTLQIGACARQDGNPANGVCGTWYAEIEVR